MRIHPYFRMLPRVRLYFAKPMRAGCITSTSLILILLLLAAVSRLHGQVDGVLHLSGRDAELRVANPTAKPLKVSVTLFRDSTLADTVACRISPATFTLAPGAEQVVRLRLRTKPDSTARYRLGTTFAPVADEAPPQPTMRFIMQTRILTRVVASP